MTDKQTTLMQCDCEIYGGTIQGNHDPINPHPDSPAPLLAVERYVYPVRMNTTKSSSPPLNKKAMPKNKILTLIMRPDIILSEGEVFDDGQLEFLRMRVRERFEV